MFTEKRLLECYRKAKVILFDDADQFILFSDIHRGDNSMSDEFAHNSNLYYYALSTYLKQGYTYIELGDGDELWEHMKFEVIRSAHSDVYMLLREFYLQNRLLYVFGNHNNNLKNKNWTRKHMTEFNDEYYNQQSDLFPDIKIYESLVLKYEPTGQEFLLVHGHQGDTMNDQLWVFSMISLRFFWRFLHVMGFQNPSSPAKNRIKRHHIEEKFSKWIEKYRMPIVCGHTHRPKLPLGNESYYFNTGCCIHPRGINGIEISKGKIMLVDWRERPSDDGCLRISKKIIRGPRPLSEITMNK